jgi:hypothetical protein
MTVLLLGAAVCCAAFTDFVPAAHGEATLIACTVYYTLYGVL